MLDKLTRSTAVPEMANHTFHLITQKSYNKWSKSGLKVKSCKYVIKTYDLLYLADGTSVYGTRGVESEGTWLVWG